MHSAWCFLRFYLCSFQSVSSCFSYFVAFQYLREISVNPFLPNVPILYPLKKGFLTFSGSIEIEHWDKMGQIGDRNETGTHFPEKGMEY